MQPGTGALQIVSAGLTGMTVTEIVALIGLGINLAGFVFAFTKGMDKIKDTIRLEVEKVRDTINKRVEELTHTMAEHEIDDERRFAQVARDIDASGDKLSREMGETIKALREYVHQIELAIKDGIIKFGEQLAETRHTVYGRLDQQHEIHDETEKELEKRLRELEISSARKG